MPSARERVEEVLRGMRQRQEQQAEARALWRKALPRCEALARALAEPVRAQGLAVVVEARDERLDVSFPPQPAFGTVRPVVLGSEPVTAELVSSCGPRAEFRFNPATRCLEGWRRRAADPGPEPPEENFFSLSVRPRPSGRPAAANDFGPGPSPDVPVAVDSQEAFERAVADFLEWALVKEGAGGRPVRLP